MMENKNKLVHSKELSHDLSEVVDQDIHQESELLKSLIEDILSSNEKIKQAHFELVDDTEEKLQQLNREISRIKTTLDQNDELLQNDKIEALHELKQMYYEQLSFVRLHDLKEHFKQPIESVFDELKNTFTQRYQHYVSPKAQRYIDILHDMLNFYVTKIRRFEDDTNLFYEANQIDIDNIDERFKLIFEAFEYDVTQFQTQLEERLYAWLNNENEQELLLALEKERTNMQERLKEGKEPMDELTGQWLKDLEAYDQRIKNDHDRLFTSLSKGKESTLTKEKQANDVLKHRLQLLKEQIVNGQLTTRQQTKLLASYDKLYQQYLKTTEGKIEKNIEKRLKTKLKAIEKSKHDRTLKYYHQLFQIKEKLTLQELQSRLSILTTLTQDREQKMTTSLKQVRELEATLKTHLKNMRDFVLGLFDLDYLLKSKMFDTFKDIQLLNHQWNDELMKLKSLIQRQELQLLKTLKENHYELKLFYKDLEYMGYEHTLKLKFTHRLNDLTKARLNAQTEAVFDMMEDKEQLMNEQIEAENAIMIAEREHDIQVLKAQSMYDHEVALTKAKTERLDAGVSINKTLLQTALKRQVKFAKQQLNFIEKEYDVRCEHIEYTYTQEVKYLEAKLKALLKPYTQQEQDIKKAWDNARSNVTTYNPMLHNNKQKKRFEQERIELDEGYKKKLQSIEEAKRQNADLQRYVSLIAQADEVKEQALEDALNIKETDAKAFEELLSESETRLNQFEQILGAPEELTYEGDDQATLAAQRLKERLASAQEYLDSMTAQPQEKLKAILDRLEALTPTLPEESLQALQAQEDDINAELETRLSNLKEEHTSVIQTLLKEQDDTLSQMQQHIATLTKHIDEPDASEKALEERLNAQQEKRKEDFKTKQKVIEARFSGYANDVTHTFEKLRTDYISLVEKNKLMRETLFKRKEKIIEDTKQKVQHEKQHKLKQV